MRARGEIWRFGAGLTSTTGSGVAGNHVTRSGAPTRSHERAALAISKVPNGQLPSERHDAPAAGRDGAGRVNRSVDDLADRAGEAEAHRCAWSDAQPAARELRHRRVEGEPLGAAPAERPPEPAGAADDDLDRDALAWSKERFGRQAAAADDERDPRAAGPERLRRDERSSERLHLDPRERRSVSGERGAGPPDDPGRHRDPRHAEQGEDEQDRAADEPAPTAARARARGDGENELAPPDTR